MTREIVRRILRGSFPQVDSDEPSGYYGAVGGAVDALMYGWLYWPDVVEFHGAVFVVLDGEGEVEIAERLTTSVVDKHPDWPELSWVEAVDSFNVFEIEHLFGSWRGPVEIYADVHQELAKVLARAWAARLLEAYPDRRFEVRILGPDDAMGLRVEIAQQWPALTTPRGWDAQRRVIVSGRSADT